jgi:Mn-dependent DtxR family transcriptional regulator
MDKDGFLTLTPAGEEIAVKIYERHTVLSKALMTMGIRQKAAAEDACKIEHVISDETFDAIKAHLDKYYVSK